MHRGDRDPFREYLILEGLSAKTVSVYYTAVGRCLLWAHERDIDLAHITGMELIELTEGQPQTRATLSLTRASLKLYWQWRGIPDPPIKAIRVPPKPRAMCRAVEPDAARDLVKTAMGWHPKGTAVLLGLYLALRRAEIAAARWDAFTPAMDWYTVREGKGGRTDRVPVAPTLKAELLPRRQDRDGFMFPGHAGRDHITPATIWNWIRAVSREAGIGNIQPHRLRHTALATLNDTTGDLRAVAEFARHRRVETTMTYTRTTGIRLQSLAEELDYG